MDWSLFWLIIGQITLAAVCLLPATAAVAIAVGMFRAITGTATPDRHLIYKGGDSE